MSRYIEISIPVYRFDIDISYRMVSSKKISTFSIYRDIFGRLVSCRLITSHQHHARRSTSVCTLNCSRQRHHISPWLEKKTRKTKKQLAAWCSQGRTSQSHCTRGLDSGWRSR